MRSSRTVKKLGILHSSIRDFLLEQLPGAVKLGPHRALGTAHNAGNI